jgi:hypothetical protein
LAKFARPGEPRLRQTFSPPPARANARPHPSNTGPSQNLTVFSPFPGPDGKFYFSTNWDYQTGKLGTRKKEIHRADLVMQGGTPTPLNPRNFDDAIANDARQFGIKLPDGFHVNSDEDDEFPFITPDRKAIFLSSGRASANSQQDVYAFALPVSRIRLQVRVMEQLQDSSGDSLGPVQSVNYPVDVVDTAGGIPAAKGEGGIWLLEPDRTYSVNLGGISVNDCFDIQVYNSQQQNVRTVLPFGGDTLLTREFMVTRRRIAVPQVVFQATETLPYFITGYWWPNTVENLKMFDSRSSSGFFEHSGFLNRQDYNYDSIATIISHTFEERLYKPLDRVLPRFTAKCADTLALVVTVHGYTDPRRLRPEHVYPDQTVTIGSDVNGLPTTIVTGSDMTQADWKVDPNNPNSPTVHLKNNGEQGNIILSKLRAYYTFRTLDTIMKKRSPVYARLAREGRVVLDAEGFGKYRDDGPDDDPQSRRIEIYLDAVPMSQVAEFKREQGGKVRGADLARRKRVTRDTMSTASRQKERHREGTGDTALAPVAVVPAMDTSSDTLALHPTKDPAAVSCYTIQYCSVQDEGLAHSRARILMEHGVEDARVVPFADKDGTTLYRVRSGCYENVNEAIRALGGYSWATKALDLRARPVVVR